MKNGGGRIRTHGRLLTYNGFQDRYNGFQDRRLKPLGHSSKGNSLYIIFLHNARVFLLNFKKLFMLILIAFIYYNICCCTCAALLAILPVGTDRIFYTITDIFIISAPAVHQIWPCKFIATPFTFICIW